MIVHGLLHANSRLFVGENPNPSKNGARNTSF